MERLNLLKLLYAEIGRHCSYFTLILLLFCHVTVGVYHSILFHADIISVKKGLGLGRHLLFCFISLFPSPFCPQTADLYYALFLV